MAVDKALTPFDIDVQGDEVVIIEDGDDEALDSAMGADITELADGGMEIDFAPGELDFADDDHTANLATVLAEDELTLLADDLIERYESDKRSREDWEQMYAKGLELVGLNIEERTEPWQGASGVWHPLLSESVIRFQSQTIGEILPPKGPVEVSIWGKQTDEVTKRAQRVKKFMNYTVLNRMIDYRPETEKMLFNLPLAGSAFRKVYQHPHYKRPCSHFLPAEDVVVNYAETSIEEADTVTVRMKRSETQILQLMDAGFYRDVELGDPVKTQRDTIEEAKLKTTGMKSVSMDDDGRYDVLEFHVNLDLPGYEDTYPLPYIVTVEQGSRKVLAIYRNWDENDETRAKEQHLVHYCFIPGMGFYGLGLIHLIGSLAKASTSILRQLIDAGTLSNLPAGLKTRGLRIKGDETPLRPGEFRDVDVPSGKIQDNITFAPFKEPSAVLFQLFQGVVNDGRRLASMADMKVADMNQEAPVGTTLAIIERSMKVQTAIQQRIHDAMKQEFRILKRVIRKFDSLEYPYEVEEGEQIKAEDFSDDLDIIPVSDPNAASFAQRIMKYQALLQLSAQNPGIYDMEALHRQMGEAMEVPNMDLIIPQKSEVPAMDPVAENMAILNTKPVRAMEYQDHEAHLRVHMAFKGDPQIAQLQQNSPMGNAILSALDAHIREHIAYQYRYEIARELGVELPSMEEPIPAEVESRLSAAIADAADQLTGKKQAMAQAQQQAQQQADPFVQMKQQELQIQQQKVQAQMQEAQMKLQMQMQKQQQDAQDKAQQRQLQMEIESARIKLESIRLQMEAEENAAQREAEGFRMGNELVRGING